MTKHDEKPPPAQKPAPNTGGGDGSGARATPRPKPQTGGGDGSGAKAK